MKRFVFSIVCSLSVLAASSAQGQEVTISPPSGTLTINEGDSATINVTQTADSSTTYRYQVYTARENTGDPAPDDWSYQPWNWYVHSTTTQGSLTNSVTIQTFHDDDGQDDTGYDATLFLYRTFADDTGLTKIAEYPFTIKDDDTRGIVIPSKYFERLPGNVNDSLVVDEGSDKTFTLALATEPVGGDVTIRIRQAPGPVTFYPSTLTFKSNGGNWRAPQTITLRALEDDDAITNGSYLYFSASGADYEGISIEGRWISIVDNDSAEFAPSVSTLSIDEGNEAKFTLKLTAKPWPKVGGPVIIRLNLTSSHSHVSVSPSTLNFRDIYWNVPQTVTVRADDDDDAVDPAAATIDISVDSGGDGALDEYQGFTDTIAVNVSETDTAGVDVYNSSGVRPFGLTTLEGADIDYKMRLTSKPRGGNVTLDFSMSNGSDVSLSPTSLTFTPSNWKTLQTVTATTAEDDDEIRNDSTLTIAASGADYGDYSRTMDVYANDNDVPTYIRRPAGSVTVNEGEIVDFTIRLTAKPAENMTVVHNIPQGNSSLYRIEDKSDGITTFHFTPDNWNVPQTVSYFALWKSKGTNDDNVRRLTTRMLTGISGRIESYVYDQVIIAGNGSPMVLSSDTLDIGEGSSGTFTLRLREKPVDDSNLTDDKRRIVVALRKSGSGDVTISPTSLTFTPSDWDTAQTVTVSTVADADSADDSARISFSASGTTFGTANLTDGVRISVKEKALVLSPSALDIDEGGSERFGVELATKPSGNVTVSLTSSDSQLSVSPVSLIFTPSNWNSAQNVTANAAEDDDRVASTARIDLSASGADYAGITARVAVSIGDDDAVRFSPVYEIDAGNRRKAIDALRMPEFSYRILGMYLEAKPSGNVTVSLATSGHAGLTVEPTSLTFTPSNYYTLQKFRVRSPIFHGATEKSLTLSASGGDYDGVVRKLSVTVDDSNGLGISEGQIAPLEIVEGESETFTVVLRDTLSGNERAHVDLAKSEGTDSSVITDKILSISPRVLRFDSTNHSRPQTVTIAALADDDRDDENGSFSLDAYYYDPPNGADLSGNGWRAYQTRSATHNVNISVKDNTVLQPSTPAGLTLSETSTLRVPEGGSATFTVVLGREPTGGSVTVSASVSAGSDLSLSPTRLTFTASNWDKPQTVTVRAAEDDDAANDNASVSLSASGADYGGVSKTLSVSIVDDDPRGLAFDSLDLGLTEGSQKQFTVKLVSQPSGGDVTVAITKSSGSDDVSFSPASLTFTDSNWTTPQNVTVSAAEDADGVDDRATLSAVASGADYAGISDSVSVKITDNDKPGLTIDPSSLDVPEGGSANFKVKLTGAPNGGDVSVAIVKSGSGDVTISLASLTFAAANWASEQTVTVNAAEDDDAANDTASLSLTASGANYGGITDSVDIEVSDDEDRNLTLSDSSLGLTEGTSKDFTVKLTAAPTGGDVTVTVNKSGSDDVTVSPASLTFKAGNWNTPQNVTVNAAEDGDGVADNASVSLTVSGADYAGIADSVVRIEVTDNDTPGLTLPLKLEVAEGGDQTLGVSLTAQPSGGNVTVAIAKSGSDDVTISPASLIFTDRNWESVQSVTVSAAEDEDGADDNASLALTASGADYGDVSAGVQIEVSDDDEKGLSVASTLSLSEGGSKDFTFRLQTKPVGGDVSVAVTKSGSTDVSVSPSSLTFEASNWNTPQTVSVSAAEDEDGANDSARVSLAASGADYGGISEAVSVDVTDNDTPGLTLDPLKLEMDEGDDELLGISLTAAPTGGNVTVSLTKSGSDDVTISPASLTFTADNWESVQSVTVSAQEDEDGAADSASLSLSASGADYDDVSDVVQVAVKDNDEKGLSVDSTLSLNEGGDKDLTFSLKTKPVGGEVSVAVTKSGSGDVTISKESATFTAENWNDPQTLNVSAAEDADGVNDSARISLSASGADYGGIGESVRVDVSDNDSPGLTLAPTSLSVNEGGDERLGISLTAAPTGGNVIVAIAKSGSDDVTVSPASLTFTADNWKSVQSVTVRAAEDEDGAADSASLSLSASGADYDDVSDVVQVAVKDNDEKGLSVDPTLSLNEGGDKDLTFSLKTKPVGGDVTVAITKSGSTDVSVSPSSLTFTAENWNNPQTLNVSAAEDSDGVDDSARISLSASGADYGGLTADISVEVSDKDTPGLTLAPTTLKVDEGDDTTLEVSLSAQPSGGNVTVAVAKSGSDDVTISPTSLTFTPSNWRSTRSVTVSAAEDDDGADDNANLRLTASGADYAGIVDNVRVEVDDDDPKGLTLAPESLSVTEGSAKDFTVALKTQPASGSVVVSLNASGSSEVSVSPARMTFTASNWNAPKTATVNADEDDDGVKDTATVSLAASGADYGAIADELQVEVNDNDAPGLTFDPSTLDVAEGGEASLEVGLTVQPTGGDVTLALTKSGSEDVSLSPASLTFTPDDWSAPRIVTVVAAEDDDGVKDTAALSVAASGADYDGITGNVQVRVSENETVGLVVEPAILGLTEGGEGAFTAKLSAQPTGGNVALFVTKSGSPDVLLTSTNLIFTADDWSVEQSVTVRANEDHDGIADSAVVSLSASGADYGGVSGGVQVQVSDNDAPGLVLSSLLLAVDEGGSGRVGVKLSVEPSGDVSLALTKNGSVDVSFTPSSMTFTPSNWDESQAITVNAAEDSDGHPDTASLSLTATGADYEGITAGVQVQVVENEAFGLSATPRELEVREGEEAPFTVSLTAQPNWNVSVALTSENPDVSLSPSTLRFTPSDWNRPKTVVARAAEDDDLLADSTTVTLRASGADFDDITGSMQITVIDDDAEEGINPQVVFDLTLTPESLSLDEGSSARFTVRARVQPVDEEIVVALVGGGSPDVSFDTDPETDGLQSALTLTPDNWDVEQPVSVHAAEDDDAAPDRASASFVDAGGKVIIVGRVSVAVADDDTPGLSVDPAALQVAENTSGSFTVRPVTRPLGDILVSFDNGETDTALSPPNLKFTSSNWRRARSVTVDGVADVDAEDDAPADITLTARGGGYDGVSARVQVGVDEAAPGTLPEEATPGLVIVGAPVEIDEGGTRDLRVRLRNRPTGDVELALSVSGASIEVDADTWREGNQSALRFSPSNYNGTRVVSLFAPEDEDTNDGRASVSLVASGANYDGLTAEVSVNIDDNDSPALLVSNPAVIDDRRASFTVRLSVEPSAAVDVALSVAGEVEGVAVDTDPDTPGNQTALAFAASNFDVPQRVVVVADEDFEGSSVDIVLAAGGGDYEGIVDRVTVPLGVGEYTDEGDPRYWWPVRTLALAIAPPSVGDRAVVSVGCREESACEVYLDCSAQKNGESFRGGLPDAIVGWGVARLSAQDIVDITGGDWSGMGRLGCALHSEERISAQVWTRSGDGVLVNNSALVRSVNIEGVHRADIESIPGPGELDLSNIRIRCRAAYTKHCGMTALSCYDDEGSGYRGDLGTIERGRVRHVQTSELADLIGHRWSGATLGCEFRSDEPFTVQVLTRTGGGGALVNNNATGQAPF